MADTLKLDLTERGCGELKWIQWLKAEFSVTHTLTHTPLYRPTRSGDRLFQSTFVMVRLSFGSACYSTCTNAAPLSIRVSPSCVQYKQGFVKF